MVRALIISDSVIGLFGFIEFIGLIEFTAFVRFFELVGLFEVVELVELLSYSVRFYRKHRRSARYHLLRDILRSELQ
jgi:hypothetical protein